MACIYWVLRSVLIRLQISYSFAHSLRIVCYCSSIRQSRREHVCVAEVVLEMLSELTFCCCVLPMHAVTLNRERARDSISNVSYAETGCMYVCVGQARRW
jgi:hypothetical protein